MNATTLVVGADASKPVEGEVADCIMAAHTATELAARMITIGNDVSAGRAGGRATAVSHSLFFSSYRATPPFLSPLQSLTVGKAIDAVAKDFGVTPLEGKGRAGQRCGAASATAVVVSCR